MYAKLGREKEAVQSILQVLTAQWGHQVLKLDAVKWSVVPGRVELGRVYAKLGREEEAERELLLAESLPVEDINAYLQLLDGQAILRSLKQRGRRRGPFGRCLAVEGLGVRVCCIYLNSQVRPW